MGTLPKKLKGTSREFSDECLCKRCPGARKWSWAVPFGKTGSKSSPVSIRNVDLAPVGGEPRKVPGESSFCLGAGEFRPQLGEESQYPVAAKLNRGRAFSSPRVAPNLHSTPLAGKTARYCRLEDISRLEDGFSANGYRKAGTSKLYRHCHDEDHRHGRDFQPAGSHPVGKP